MDLNQVRQEYTASSIDVDSVAPCPFSQFESWFMDAGTQDILEPNAMVLSTVGRDDQPTQRTVLLKYFDNHGVADDCLLENQPGD